MGATLPISFLLLSMLMMANTCSSSSHGESSSVPELGNAYYYYYSNSDKFLTIEQLDEDRNVLRVVRLPRKYVYFVDEYARKESSKRNIKFPSYDYLPDKVSTSGSISLVLYFPGEYSANFAGEGVSAGRQSVSNGTVYFNTKRGNTPSITMSEIERLRKAGVKEFSDGILNVLNTGSHNFHGYIPDVGLIAGRCFETSRPVFQCSYRIPLGKDVFVASFMDYRFNGGVPFIRERVLNIRKALCPHLGCD